MKAIETQYKGYRFRSRLEARWAVFFDALGVEWRYEDEGYELNDKARYLPDFWLPSEQCWVEVKPNSEYSEQDQNKIERLREESGKDVIVLCGKIGHEAASRNRWRGNWIRPIGYNSNNRADSYLWETALSSPRGLDGVRLLCPICRDDYVHMQNVEESRGNDNYEAWEGRGDVVKLRLYCEQEHRWVFLFGAHKGTLYFQVRDVEVIQDNFLVHLAKENHDLLEAAFEAARSARFEHGESPKVF